MVANFKMLARNRQAMFWAIVFPLIFVVVFGIFFADDTPTITLAVIDHANDDMSQRMVSELDRVEGLVFVQAANEADAREQIREGDLGFALVMPEGMAEKAINDPPAEVRMIYDNTKLMGGIALGSVEGFIATANAEISNVPSRLVLDAEGINGQDLSTFDFILPGIAVWGVMSFSVIGLATTLTAYREKRIFARMQATPLKVRTFFLGEVITYLILALVQIGIVMGVGVLAFGANLNGNLFYMALILIFANLVFLNLGFVVAAYSRTVQAASGLGNAVVLPIVFFSGVFFPTDALPTVLKYLVDALPLAPVLSAIRGVALEAQPIWAFPVELATIGCWLVISALVAVWTFKFK